MRGEASPAGSDRTWAVSVSLLALGLGLTPYLAGYALAPPDVEFGGLVMNIEDSHSYLAKMLQGAQGHLLYRIPYTAEQHEPAFVGGFYFFWGWVARSIGAPLMLVWHLSRIASGAFLLWATYRFIAHFLTKPEARRLAFLLAVFSSGLGWVLLLLGLPFFLDFFPIDFKMPEAHLFFTLMTFPHFSFATGLLLLVFLDLLTYLEKGLLRHALWIGVEVLLLIITLPYLAYLVAGLGAIYISILVLRNRAPSWKRLLGLWPALAIPAPLIVYYGLVFTRSLPFRAWAEQSVTLSPHPLHYLIAYLPLGLLALPGLVAAWRERNTRSLLLLSWALGGLALAYLPLAWQRRLIMGYHLPLSLLAAMGAHSFWLPRWSDAPWLQRWAAWRKMDPSRMASTLLSAFFLFSTISNVYILASLAVTAAQHPYPFFRERAEVEAVEWLARAVPSESVILSSDWTGGYIPARSSQRVFIGHWAETLDFSAKLSEARRFFDAATPDKWRREFLATRQIDYLFYGPREREWGAFEPSYVPYLIRRFSNSLVSIYEVSLFTTRQSS